MEEYSLKQTMLFLQEVYFISIFKRGEIHKSFVKSIYDFQENDLANHGRSSLFNHRIL